MSLDQASSTDVECVKNFIFNDKVQSILSKINNHLLPSNILEICGMGGQEIKHSRLLGWLLGGDYDFKDELFCEFLKHTVTRTNEAIGSGYEYTHEELEKVRRYIYLPQSKRQLSVRYEYKNIDILIIDETNKVVVVIENKVFASESDHQLKKYREIVDREFDDYHKIGVFLTPDSEEPRNDKKVSGARENRSFYMIGSYEDISVSLREIIKKFGEHMDEQSKLLSTHYIDHLVRMGIVENSELEKLCVEILNNPDYRRAIDIISDYKIDRQSEIRNYLEGLFSVEADLKLDHSSKTYIRFSDSRIKHKEQDEGQGWTKSKKVLLYEFQNYKNGVRLKLIIGPSENTLFRERIYTLKDKPWFKNNASKLYEKFHYTYDCEILTEKDIADLDLDEIEVKIRKNFDKFLKKDLNIILEDINSI